MPEDYDFDAAIVHPNRICEIEFILRSLQLKRLALLAPAMQEQFPALTISRSVRTLLENHLAPALPDRLLGGSAPRLQSLKLNCIPLPALPKLLLSAADLVYLYLHDIPLGTCHPRQSLRAWPCRPTSTLFIKFEPHNFAPVGKFDAHLRKNAPSSPALIRFELKEVSEWLEVLVVRSDHSPLKRIFFKRSALRIEEMDQQLSTLVQVIKPLFPSICRSQHALNQWEDEGHRE